jgi:oligoribonuclease
MKKIYLKDPIVWIDLEMTGLDLSRDKIIEIAVVLTDGHLKNKIIGPNIIINCEKTILGN